MKTDSAGNKQWDKDLGAGIGSSLLQTSDGGYVIVGSTHYYGTGADVWLIKTDSAGNKQWDRTFGSWGSDSGSSALQTSDGGYVIVGSTHPWGAGNDDDVWLIKTDSAGNKEWDKTFGGAEVDEGCSVLQTSDGGYIILGNTYSYGAGNSDIWLIRTDSSGEKVWDMTFGGSEEDWGYSVGQTSDGGYFIAGLTMSYGAGDCDVWLLKLRLG